MPLTEPARRIARSRKIVLRSVAALADGKVRTNIVHDARIQLRRLQAFLELIGEAHRAQRIADCVSTLSPLRTLQVMEKYLAEVRASKRDRRSVARRVSMLLEKLRRKKVYQTIEKDVREQTADLPAHSDEWMAARFRLLRQDQAAALADQLAATAEKPRRRALHALRLQIKAIRYQEELALHSAFGKPDVVERLKEAQTVLGVYEEQAEFRKLARNLRLACRKQIKKDWRRARKKARRIPDTLTDIPDALLDDRLLFLRPSRLGRHFGRTGDR